MPSSPQRMSLRADYDVAVVGAGPAGSATAITLARAGLRVALLDRQSFPRTKPCGDLIGCGGVALAQTLGIETTTLNDYHPLRGAVVLTPQSAPLVLTARPGTLDARVIPRHIFDTALVHTAETAGVTFHHLTVRDLARDAGGRVTGVVTERDGVTATLSARAVIGADGYGSRIARAVRGTETTRAGQVGVALRAYARHLSVPDAWQGHLVFAYDEATAPGYGWLMPLPDGAANLGIGTLTATDVPNTASLRDLFARFLARTPWLAGAEITEMYPPRSWPLALGPRRGALVADGVLLAGEAAALVGPMTGAGIYPALQSGVWAGETLVRALQRGDVSRSALQPYERRVRRRFAPQHHAEALAQRLLTEPRHLHRLVNAVRPLPFTGPVGASLLLHLG